MKGGVRIEVREIGRIHSVYTRREETPRQGKLSDKEAVIEVFSDYKEGLDRLENLSHIIVLYWANQSERGMLKARPPWARESYGVFATRSPNRPNPILFCVCQVKKIEGNKISVTGLDALNGSPLLDIKPYSAEIDSYPEARTHQKKIYKEEI